MKSQTQSMERKFNTLLVIAIFSTFLIMAAILFSIDKDMNKNKTLPAQADQLCRAICLPTQHSLNSTGCYCYTPYQPPNTNQTYWSWQAKVKTT
ncbi:MAG: hypothetical protein CMI54_08745 [Parcubacteria group bacterium]|nr:hypothetical protein [Parcubacteria group bacterium]